MFYINDLRISFPFAQHERVPLCKYPPKRSIFSYSLTCVCTAWDFAYAVYTPLLLLIILNLISRSSLSKTRGHYPPLRHHHRSIRFHHRCYQKRRGKTTSRFPFAVSTRPADFTGCACQCQRVYCAYGPYLTRWLPVFPLWTFEFFFRRTRVLEFMACRAVACF